MAIVVKFDVGGVDSSKYDQIIRQLDEIGEGVPDGRISNHPYANLLRLAHSSPAVLTVTLTVTGTDTSEQPETQSSRIQLNQAIFGTPTNSGESLQPPSHGRGHEFKSRRAHSQNRPLVVETRADAEDEESYLACLTSAHPSSSGYCRYDGRMSQGSRD